MTALSVLGVASLLALPLFALPAITFGAPVSRGPLRAALVAVGGFVLLAGFGIVVLATDAPLSLIGRTVERVWNRFVPRRRRLTGLPQAVAAGA